MDRYPPPSPFAGPMGSNQQYAYSTHPNTPPRPSHLNPQIPSFEPQGTELQRYQPLPPTPPPTNAMVSPDLLKLRDRMMESHFQHTRDLVGLERQTKQNTKLIQDTRGAVQNDLRFLQDQVLELKEQFEAQKLQVGEGTPRQSLAAQDVTPPKEFLQNFSKERIAEVYVEEAQDYEIAAARLREQAAELRGDDTPTGNRRKLLQAASNGLDHPKETSEFACCGMDFTSMSLLLIHVHHCHRREMDGFDHRKDSVDVVDAFDTPTHVPPRRARPAEDTASRQTEIRVADPVTPTQVATPTETPSPTAWTPLAVQQMPPTQRVAAANTETFPLTFLHHNFSGKEWSSGFYFISSRQAILPSKSYWMLDAENEPFLPTAPGLHGAKLTAFFNCSPLEAGSKAPEEKNYLNVPVFVKSKDSKNGAFIYFGNYSQRRVSDKLDYDHLMSHVPESVRRHHAREIANPTRPKWLSAEIRQHFWPKPPYDGPIPTDSAINTPNTEASGLSSVSVMPEKRVLNALISYASELKDWEKDSNMRLSHITEESLMKAFERADEDEEPGLRLFFEYLQFEAYDQEFYEFLVELKQNPKLQGPFPERGRKPTRDGEGGKGKSGGKIVDGKVNGGVETVRADGETGAKATPPHLRRK